MANCEHRKQQRYAYYFRAIKAEEKLRDKKGKWKMWQCSHDNVKGKKQESEQQVAVKKHAYLIMAHTEFTLLNKLIVALDDERADIYLHVDMRAKDFSIDQIQKLVKHSNVYAIKRRKINWGGVFAN